MLVLGVPAFAASACATAGQGGDDDAAEVRRQTLDMDPMHLEVVRRPGGDRVEVMDPKTLFFEGNAAFERNDFALAYDKYALVADRFPDSRYALVSAFNAGLSLEKLERWSDAIPWFDRVAKAASGSKDAQDALFRIAICQEGLEDWVGMRATTDELLRPHHAGINLTDRVSAHAQRGFARQKLGQLALAERDYKAALELFHRNMEDRGLQQSRQIGLAQFQIAEIYRELFGAIRFRLPIETMARDLEDKSNFFLMSQSGYLRTLRMRHPDFSVIAGYRLGALYEDMYEDMLAAEIPPELTREEVALYYEELRGQIRPLLVRAIDIYERNLRMGQAMGKQGDWMRKTEASLARLKEVLRQESTRDAEAELRRSSAE